MKAIVLGAGKGKRLLSEDIPKVLRKANGKALIDYALSSIDFIEQQDTVIVVGYQHEKVIDYLGSNFQYAIQTEQKGTGHAVQMAEDLFKNYDGDVVIIYGDMPLFQKITLTKLIKKHRSKKADCTVLTAVTDEPMAYGRIIRDERNLIRDIIEEKDCTNEQKNINELNVGIYVFRAKVLFENIKYLKNSNAQGEYYLTDVPKILMSEYRKVESHTIFNSDEIYGVNTPEDLKRCEAILKNRSL